MILCDSRITAETVISRCGSLLFFAWCLENPGKRFLPTAVPSGGRPILVVGFVVEEVDADLVLAAFFPNIADVGSPTADEAHNVITKPPTRSLA